MVKIWKNPGNSGRNEKLAIKFKLRGHSLTFWPNFGLYLKSELCPVNCHPSLGVPSANRLIKISFAVLIDPPRGCPRVAFPPRPLLTICGCLLLSGCLLLPPFLFCPSQSFQRPPAPIKISFFCRCRSRPPLPARRYPGLILSAHSSTLSVVIVLNYSLSDPTIVSLPSTI